MTPEKRAALLQAIRYMLIGGAIGAGAVMVPAGYLAAKDWTLFVTALFGAG